MPKLLKSVASDAMDLYYQQYKSETDFFSKEDFIIYCGNALTDYYQQEYLSQKAMFRSEKKDEIVSFPDSCLSSIKLAVKDQEAKLGFSFAAFPGDAHNTGIQHVFITNPKRVYAERTNMEILWKLPTLPQCERVYWLIKGDIIRFERNGSSNVIEAEIFYVPTATADMLVPDGVIEYITLNTPAKMKQIAQGTIVKKSGDGNPNKVLETEIDKTQLR